MRFGGSLFDPSDDPEKWLSAPSQIAIPLSYKAGVNSALAKAKSLAKRLGFSPFREFVRFPVPAFSSAFPIKIDLKKHYLVRSF